ncbi:MAG: NADP-dependent glyceraldehyde-3-phosphate dehydrogenase [archaeon]
MEFPDEQTIPRAYITEPLHQKTYLINGQIAVWNGPVQDVYSPIHVKTTQGILPRHLGSYPLMTEREAMAALHAAVSAFNAGRGAWPTMTTEQRIQYFVQFTAMLEQQRSRLVNLLMWEIGKNLKDAEKEFDRTIVYIKDTIESLKDLDRISSRFTLAEGIIGQIKRSPLGVVLCMGPFNYPLNETFSTLIPALIMGNTVIFKPPKYGVLLYEPLLELFKIFPAGVINTIYGDGPTVITPLMNSGKIDVLAFIGSSKVADIIRKQHPKPHRLRCVLGLEAKNPGIVLANADVEFAVKECLLGALSFNGQRCTALKIIFVHESIVDKFLKTCTESLAKLNIGMPWDNAAITPLPEQDKTTYLANLVEDAKKKGAKVMNPGGGTFSKTLFTPALLYPVAPNMDVYTVEQFGPVIPVRAFKHIEEPIQYLMDSNYGQQVSIFGSDPDMIAALIDPLTNLVCRVNINSQCQRGPDIFPFTGRKDSAEGTLSVSDALRVFTIRSLVAAKGTDLNKTIITDIVKNRKSNFLSTDFIL